MRGDHQTSEIDFCVVVSEIWQNFFKNISIILLSFNDFKTFTCTFFPFSSSVGFVLYLVYSSAFLPLSLTAFLFGLKSPFASKRKTDFSNFTSSCTYFI